MNSLLSTIIKKSIPYFVVFGIGIYAGFSIIRFKPEFFYFKQIPKDQIEATILAGKVGKLMSLPTDEEQIVETVTDLAVLKDKPFFSKAEIGDKVLIYEKAALAILYRPSKNIIINTLSPNYQDAVFSLTASIATPVPTPIPTPIPTPTEPVPTGSSLSPTPTTTSTAVPSPTATI